jgi:hypothetical protein
MDLLSLLTPEQKTQLLQQLLGAAPSTPAVAPPPAPVVTPVATAVATPPETKKSWPPRTKGKLNMDDAIAITFKAQLEPNERARDQSWAETYDHIWFKGHYQVKGPKGGMYCLGLCILGNDRREQRRGQLKISNRSFLALQNGEPVDGWFIPDDTKENVLIGTLSNLTTLT